jgi:hypothetical protein
MAISTTFHVSKKRVSQAGEFIMEYGREIDKALFAHYFRKEPASTVVSILERYISPIDGGACCLEPDMDYKGSTPISCATFFQILHSMKITAEFDAANSVLSYLMDNLKDKASWIPIVPEVESEPHAIWWNWDEDKARSYSLNPTCEIIGYFYNFGGGDYRAFAKKMLDTLYDMLLQRFVGTMEMHEIINLMQLCRLLPDTLAEKFTLVLKPHLKEMIITDKSLWGEYVLSPLAIFRSPLDPLYYDFEKEINLNLDYDITSQNEDGVWEPSWHWGQYDERFLEKKNLITSYVTVNKLITLNNFGRMTRTG